jgi:hypothetical protein
LAPANVSDEEKFVRTAISFGDLDLLAGEVLPERTVLSTLVTPFSNPGADADGGGSSSAAAAAAGGGHGDNGGSTVMNSCTSQQEGNFGGSGGLAGILGLGLGSHGPVSEHSCLPGTAVSN